MEMDSGGKKGKKRLQYCVFSLSLVSGDKSGDNRHSTSSVNSATSRRLFGSHQLGCCCMLNWRKNYGHRLISIGPFFFISHLFFFSSSYPTSSFFLSSLISLAKCHLGWREKLKELLNLIEEGKLYGWLVFLRLFSTEGGGKWPHLSSLLFQHADFSSFFFVSLSGSTGPGWRLRLSVCKRRGARKGWKWPLRHWCFTLFSVERTGQVMRCSTTVSWHDTTGRAHTQCNNTRIILKMESNTSSFRPNHGPQRRWNHSPNPSFRLETNCINVNCVA